MEARAKEAVARAAVARVTAVVAMVLAGMEKVHLEPGAKTTVGLRGAPARDGPL